MSRPDSKHLSTPPIPPGNFSSEHVVDAKQLSMGPGSLFRKSQSFAPEMRSSGIVLGRENVSTVEDSLKLYRMFGTAITVLVSIQMAAGVAMVVLSAMIGQMSGASWSAMPHVPLLAAGGAVVLVSIAALCGGMLSNRPALLTYTILGATVAVLTWGYATLLLSLLWHNTDAMAFLSGCDSTWTSPASCVTLLANLRAYGVILSALSLATAGWMLGVCVLTSALAWKIHGLKVFTHSGDSAGLSVLCYAQLLLTLALGSFTVLHTLSVGDGFGFGIVYFCIPVGFSLVTSVIGIIGASQERTQHMFAYLISAIPTFCVLVGFGIFYLAVAPDLINTTLTVFQQSTFAVYRYYLGAGAVLCGGLYAAAWAPAFFMRRKLAEDHMLDTTTGSTVSSVPPKYRDA